MEITNNKVLRDIFSSAIDAEDVEFLLSLPKEVLFSQLSAIGLTQKSSSSLLNSLSKIVILGDNSKWDFLADLFIMHPNSDEKEYNKKKIERMRLQRIIDQQNLDFEMEKAFYSSLTKKA